MRARTGLGVLVGVDLLAVAGEELRCAKWQLWLPPPQRVRTCMLSLSTTPTAKLFLGGLLNDSTVGRGMSMGGLNAKVNLVVVRGGGGIAL